MEIVCEFSNVCFWSGQCANAVYLNKIRSWSMDLSSNWYSLQRHAKLIMCLFHCIWKTNWCVFALLPLLISLNAVLIKFILHRQYILFSKSAHIVIGPRCSHCSLYSLYLSISDKLYYIGINTVLHMLRDISRMTLILLWQKSNYELIIIIISANGVVNFNGSRMIHQ